jgi:hypothetical protein
MNDALQMDAPKRDALIQWVLDALNAYGGKAKVPEVAEHIWRNHEADLRNAGRLFYTWQYDMRWAAHRLRKSGRLRPKSDSPSGTWVLQPPKK